MCITLKVPGTKKAPYVSYEATHSVKVPEAGIEPALLAEHEFESCASTSSATQAAALANGGQNYS